MSRQREFIAAKNEEGHHAKIEVRRVVGVSKSSWYRWQAGTKQRNQKRDSDAQLLELIREAYEASNRAYGWRRVWMHLGAAGVEVNSKRVRRLMRQAGLVAVTPWATVRTTMRAADAPPAPEDLVQRQFTTTERDRVWVTDITYIATDEGWLYLSAILDLCSRRVVGWHTSDTQTTELVLASLRQAKRRRRPKPGLIHHSDHGCQYTSRQYQAELARLQMQPSMGRVGTCYDNAVAESFWSSLKRELICRYRWETRDEARRAINRYVRWYNEDRLHSTIGYLPPAVFESEAAA